MAVGLTGYVRLWRTSTIDTSKLRLRPPRFSAPPIMDTGPRDMPCPDACEQAPQPVETTLCSVVSRPQEFACRRIRLRADLWTDCLEHSVLVDEACDRGIHQLGSPNPAVDAFFDGACAGPIKIGVLRAATFTGRFRLRPHDQSTVYTLEVEDVENIRITPAPRVEADPSPR